MTTKMTPGTPVVTPGTYNAAALLAQAHGGDPVTTPRGSALSTEDKWRITREGLTFDVTRVEQESATAGGSAQRWALTIEFEGLVRRLSFTRGAKRHEALLQALASATSDGSTVTGLTLAFGGYTGGEYVMTGPKAGQAVKAPTPYFTLAAASI